MELTILTQQEIANWKWIPVNKDLPEEEVDVLVCDKNGRMMVTKGSYSTEIKGHFIWYITDWEFGEVVAWASLPDPYKEIKK